jgi:peptide/nickel transport system substrate-binding protein
MGRKCKTGFTKNPCFMKRRECTALRSCCHYLLPDKQSGFLQFIQGKLDFTSGLDPSYKDDILTQKTTTQIQRKRVNLITGPSIPNIWVRMDGDNKAVLDLRIRQAMNYGFDRQKMITYLRNNMGTPAVNGIPQAYQFNNAKGYTYDSEKKQGW